MSEIPARLREYVQLPPPPLPEGFETWEPKRKIEWQTEFAQSDEGQKIIDRNRELLAAASSFEIKFEEDGSFIVYDVPPGEYGIQGSLDQEINGQTYVFEVFGNLEVKPDVDEIALAPLQIAVTPLLSRGSVAPPIEVKSHDGSETLTRKSFDGSLLFVDFWSSQTPTAASEQQSVQEMFEKLKSRFDLKLLSINVDQDRKQALKFLLERNLRAGSHGFTEGMEHPMLLHFGVRGVPAYWLIDKDNKILMSQMEFLQAMRRKPDLATIVSERIEGKDEPTLADPPKHP